ncbi:MAG: alpha/beta hydrolase [Gammaproteobacteria bacterium]|nr:alpha/beta hydrolase [Gammaproteobacteria bacterium]
MTVHLRKMYVDCRFGQLHVHTAFPSSGGFDELPPLLCIHPSPLSGRVFRGLLPDLGKDRSVYAPDLPGYGESDAPETAPSVSDYAGAVGDLLDSLRLRQVDVLGYQTGALAAAELALARPEQVRRVMLAGVPVFDAKEREAFNARPWPARPRDDGSHLVEEWQRIRRSRGVHATLSRLGEDLTGALRAGDVAAWGPSAAANYAAGERLPLLRQPVLVLRPRDEFWEMTMRADSLLRDAHRVDLPEQNGGLFDTGVAEVARYAREFFDR